MSFKMKVNDEILSVIKVFSTMCNRGNIYQKGDTTNIIHYDEQDLDIIYITKIFDKLFEDREVMDIQFEGFKSLASDISYLKKGEMPEFVVDSACKSLTSKHRVGTKKYFFNKLMGLKSQFDSKRDGIIKPINNYVFQFSINERDFTHMKKRMLDVEGITSDGIIKWECDTSETFKIDFKTSEVDEETNEPIVITKDCYKVVVVGESTSKKSTADHKFFIPVDECKYHNSFELKIPAKNINKVKVTSKGTVTIGFACQPNSDIINKIEFKEKGDISESSVFLMKTKDK